MISEMNNSFINWFRNCSPYIHANRGNVVVVSLPGELVTHESVQNVICDIALLNSLGLKIILVHGARQQLDSALEAKSITSSFHNGNRITDVDILEFVKAANGSIRVELEALLTNSLVNSPMAGASIKVSSGNFVIAKPLGVIDGVDHQHTGSVRRVQIRDIKERLDNHNIVIISPLGYSLTGEVFNLNANEVAATVAKAMAADKLIFLTTRSGIKNSQQALIREMNVQTAEALLHETEQPDTVIEHAVAACKGGVNRTYVVDGRKDGALLLELFTRDGEGTMITQDDYEACRPANIDDVGGIIALITPLEEQGILVRRSREIIETDIEHYIVIERDGSIIGCASLHVLENTKIGELASLAVHPDYRDGARGDRLLKYIQKLAVELNLERLIALTTHASHWFIERGFKLMTLDELPVERRTVYNYQRGSKVFAKGLLD